MTLLVKGFVTDAGFISNVADTVTSVFELSDKALTYSRDKTIYSLPAYPANDLTVFKAINNTNGDRLLLDDSLVTTVMMICDLIKAYPATHIAPYVKNDYRDELQAAMITRAINISIGDFQQKGSVYYPKWFSFTSTDITPIEVKIYISNEEFINNYDEYEILVVPPLADTTDFNGFYIPALDKLSQTSYSSLNERIELAKGGRPNTYTKIMEFDFRNKDNLTISTKTNWGIIIYGEAGNDIDLIKDAIEAHVLANPSNVRTHWEIIFPDIFRRTEFVLLPMWNKVAVHNLTTLSNIYASMLGIKDIKDFIYTEYNDIYGEMFIYNNLVVFPYDYKGITIAAFPGTLNLSDRDQLFEIFGDYIPVNTSNMDFMRMSVATRDWAIKLEQALLAAETNDIHSSVPSGFRKVKRGGRSYVAFYYNNINYLVAYSYNSFYN